MYLIFLGGVIFVLLLPSKCVAFEVGYKENRRPRARLGMALDLANKVIWSVVLCSDPRKLYTSFFIFALNQK